MRIVKIKDPFAQVIVRGICQIYNTDDRPDEVGKRIWIQTAEEVNEHCYKALCGAQYVEHPLEKYGKRIGSSGFEERHHPGKIIGSVRLVGFWDESVYYDEVDEFGTHRHILGEGAHEEIKDKIYHDPDYPPNKAPFDPWWSEDTDIAWIFDDPHLFSEPLLPEERI